MQVRHVVAAVEVVVDEHLPVALEGPAPPLHEVEAGQIELGELADEGPEGLLERRAARLETDEHELLPARRLDRHKSVLGLVEAADAGEVRRALQLPGERVRPAVVGAAQDRGLALGLGHHRRGVVAAHVEEAAQLAVVAPHHDDRLAGEHRRDVLAGLLELVEAADHLPRAREDGPALELGDALVDVPGSRDRPGLLERSPRVVGAQDLFDRRFHESSRRVRAAVSAPAWRSCAEG